MQQVPIHCQERSGPESIVWRFSLEPGPREPPKQWSSSTHSSAWAKPYLPTLKRRGFSSRIRPSPNMHTLTDFFFSLSLWVTHRTIQSSSCWADQKYKPTTKGDHFQAWWVESNSWLHPENVIWVVIKVCFVKCISSLNYREHYNQEKPLHRGFNLVNLCKLRHLHAPNNSKSYLIAELMSVRWPADHRATWILQKNWVVYVQNRKSNQVSAGYIRSIVVA